MATAEVLSQTSEKQKKMSPSEQAGCYWSIRQALGHAEEAIADAVESVATARGWEKRLAAELKACEEICFTKSALAAYREISEKLCLPHDLVAQLTMLRLALRSTIDYARDEEDRILKAARDGNEDKPGQEVGEKIHLS